MNKILNISDDVIDTESNLKSHVLKKILFRLDMDFALVDDYQKDINELVNKRNAFAHGDRVRGPSNEEYERYKEQALNLMLKIKSIVYDNFSLKKFLKDPTAA